MRDFQAASPGRLRAVSLGSKLLYTAFAISALIGLWVSHRLYGAAVGQAGPAAYYAGAVATATAAPTPPPSGGPALDIAPEDSAPRAITELMPERKLLEVTHFHLFSIPVYVLIIAHLWLLAKIPAWLQTAGVVASIVTSGLHIAAPWLVRGSPGIAWLMPVSGTAMLVTLGVLALVSAIDMWLPKPPMSEALAEFRKRSAGRG